MSARFFRRWGTIIVIFSIALEVVAHFASEFVGRERKQAMLEGYRLSETGNKIIDPDFWSGRNFGTLTVEEWRQYDREYEHINRTAKYAYSTIYNMGPNFSGRFFQTDSRGFRIVPAPAVSTVPRVAFFGASNTWGHSTEYNAWTIPAFFQSLSAERFQTVNYGMPGYNSTLSTFLLRSALIRDFAEMPFNAVVMYGFWGDCSAATDLLKAKSPVLAHASDGFSSPGLRPVLFKQELERLGMLVFDFPQLWNLIRKRLSLGFEQLWTNIIERERVWRFVRLIRDPDFMPWICCNAAETEGSDGKPDQFESVATDVAIDRVLQLASDNMAVVRAMGRKYGFQSFFVLEPMAFTKLNPAPGENTGRGFDHNVLVRCMATARERFGNEADFIDLSTKPLPDQRVFTDIGHMVGAGNHAVARNLLNELTPRITVTSELR